ncbi:MAG: dUTP diphosphatase [Pseudomonadota bacterium]
MTIQEADWEIEMKTPPRIVIQAMLELQAGMNSKINTNWLNANYPFLRAALVESVEALEHYGWKWWKSQKPDISQVRIELIDIWHFVLSHYLVTECGNISKAAIKIENDWDSRPDIYFDGRQHISSELDFREKLELMAASFAVRKPALPLLLALFDACEISTEDLYIQYVCKNVLNHFRQDHGYRTGEYRKTWDGREDNEHMQELIEDLDSASGSLAQDLYAALEKRYQMLSKERRLGN